MYFNYLKLISYMANAGEINYTLKMSFLDDTEYFIIL